MAQAIKISTYTGDVVKTKSRGRPMSAEGKLVMEALKKSKESGEWMVAPKAMKSSAIRQWAQKLGVGLETGQSPKGELVFRATEKRVINRKPKEDAPNKANLTLA